MKKRLDFNVPRKFELLEISFGKIILKIKKSFLSLVFMHMFLPFHRWLRNLRVTPER